MTPERRSVHPGRKVCQFCREVFPTDLEKMLHASLDHQGEKPLPFTRCPCDRVVFRGQVCPCGRLVQ